MKTHFHISYRLPNGDRARDLARFETLAAAANATADWPPAEQRASLSIEKFGHPCATCKKRAALEAEDRQEQKESLT